jgi:hypothetical protein
MIFPAACNRRQSVGQIYTDISVISTSGFSVDEV